MTHVTEAVKSAQRCALWFLFLALFSCDQGSTTSTKYMVARVYDPVTLNAEVSYLKKLDKTKLSKELLEAVRVREEELEDVRIALDIDPNIILNISRCLPGDVRVPPLPCPVREDLLGGIPVSTQIELDLFGVHQDTPENPAARIAEDQSGAVLLTPDGKSVFAQGSLNSYDKLFGTAWYQFDVKNPALAKKPLVLRLTTVVISDQGTQTVIVEIPIPANTFLGDNLY